MKRSISLFCIIILGYTAIANGQVISIYHTNNNNGTLENCYCPDHPLGSIEKRLAYLKTARQNDPDLILLDAGDFFSVSNRQAFKDSLVAEAYALTGYDALVPGDQELFRQDGFLAEKMKLINAAIVFSNLDYELPFKTVPYKIIIRKGIRIGILGVVSEDVFKYYPDEIKNKIKLLPVVETITRVVNEIKDSTDLIILLSHQGYEVDLELTEIAEGVDIIIGGHTQTVVMEPNKKNQIFVAQAGKEGYYLGNITVQLDKGAIKDISGELIPMTLEMPDDPRIVNLIALYEKITGHINPRKKDLVGRK